MRKNRHVNRLISLTCFILAQISVPVLAQDVSGASKETGPFDPVGATMGGFVVYPSIEATMDRNDNIFALSEDEISDVVTHLNPRIEALSNWNRHVLNASLDADIGKYKDESSEDYEDWTLAVDGRIDLQRGSYFTLGAARETAHEDRSLRNAIGDIEPITYDAVRSRAGYTHTFNRLSVGLMFDREQLGFDDGVDPLGLPINHRDRDRDTDTVTLRTGYERRSGRTVFLEYARKNVDFDQRIDDDGNQRSSEEESISAGVVFDITNVIEGEASVGYFSRDFDEAPFESVDKPTLGLDITWRPDQLTAVTARINRELQETTEVDASTALNTNLALGVTREVRRNLDLSVDVGLDKNDYQQNAPAEKQNDRTLNLAVGFKYHMNRNHFLSGRYQYEQRNSDVDDEDYTRNQISLGIGVAY